MGDDRRRYLVDAAPGMWFVGSSRTWTEERKILAAIPLLMDLYDQARKTVAKGHTNIDLEIAVSRVTHALER